MKEIIKTKFEKEIADELMNEVLAHKEEHPKIILSTKEDFMDGGDEIVLDEFISRVIYMILESYVDELEPKNVCMKNEED